MELQILIRPQLWNEISKTYEAGHYKNAILAAMLYITKSIREKSGLDLDGANLISQAFGGEIPKLRINKLQTQSERDEQKGFQQLLLGLYSAVRNPRAHGDFDDNKESADAIIYFINYIITKIDIAKTPFTIENFLPRIFDINFVNRKDYAEEIVKEIPNNKRVELLIEIYRDKLKGQRDTLRYVFEAIISTLSESEIDEFINVVSEELDCTNETSTIITVLTILPANLWPKIKKTARMRIENMIIISIKKGEIEEFDKASKAGILGTYARRIIKYFTLEHELSRTLYEKCLIFYKDENMYAIKYFLEYFPVLINQEDAIRKIVDALHSVIQENNYSVHRTSLIDFLGSCSDKWIEILKTTFEDLTDIEHPGYYFPDGSPFLKYIEDDIPF